MHGQEDCWGADGYCGVAGEYMDIRYNAILYKAGTALKLRGTPTQRMDVAYNYFGIQMFGAIGSTTARWNRPMARMESHTGVISLVAGLWTGFVAACDFDGDGLNDTFSGNGATWCSLVVPSTNGLSVSEHVDAACGRISSSSMSMLTASAT